MAGKLNDAEEQEQAEGELQGPGKIKFQIIISRCHNYYDDCVALINGQIDR